MFCIKFVFVVIVVVVVMLVISVVYVQLNVMFYGLIDIIISIVNNINVVGVCIIGFQIFWFLGSCWGLIGKEDLGGGMLVIFKLELEYEMLMGNMDILGVLFNCDVWVGLLSELLGKLIFGCQNVIVCDVLGIYGDLYISVKVGLDEGGYININNFK